MGAAKQASTSAKIIKNIEKAMFLKVFGVLGAILEQLGDKMRPTSAKISQDSARWQTIAARRSKIGELKRRRPFHGGCNPRGRTRRPPCTP